MKVLTTSIPDLLMLEPLVHEDRRGWFMESFNQCVFDEAIGRHVTFVQDNHSRSTRGVLRGIHFQSPSTQAKLVRVAVGEIYDVAVDLRPGSPTFGNWVGERLSEDNHRQFWIPEGFGHGFLALSPRADVIYKVTVHHSPAHHRTIRWNDPDLEIAWPLDGLEPILSEQDRTAEPLNRPGPFAERSRSEPAGGRPRQEGTS